MKRLIILKVMALCLISVSGYIFAVQHNSHALLVDANELKKSGFTDGQTGTINVDLDNDGTTDAVDYTYSNNTPPGTCDQSGCMSNLDNSPILTFNIKMNNGKIIDGSYMCTSLGVKNTNHKGMRDIFCGPKYILKWNGEEYDTE